MIERRVVLADDHPLFREALRAALSRLRPDFAIDQADTLGDARHALRRAPEAGLLLIDLKLPGCGGLAGLLALRAEFPHAPMVVVSSDDDTRLIGDVVATGALGFIPKSASLPTISEALSAILDGEVWTPDGPIFARRAAP